MTRIATSVHADILVLRFEIEDGLPRLTKRVMAEMAREISQVQIRRNLYGCILAGGEKALAVGADIAEIAALTPVEANEFSRAGQEVMRGIANPSKPVVAAICGYCLGGGLNLALACHARVTSPNAVFGHPSGAIGILTGWGGTQRLARLIGGARAMEMLTSGRRLSAQDAWERGLVNETAGESDLVPVAKRILLRMHGATRSATPL